MTIKKQIENIIHEAKFLEVSDIHFHPLKDNVEIYYRLSDKLVFQKEISQEIYLKILRYLKFITRLDVAISKKPQDGSFSLISQEGEKFFLRISTIPLIESESLVIRILQDTKNLNISNISFYEEDIIKMKNIIINQRGLFIFTGPTGSGKTTTIYSIIEAIIIEQFKKVITIENPVEIINKKFIQVQIDESLGIDYSTSLKATLRQDPDIIMIGEIRDEKTARNVFRAALTGHTVISTMHAKDMYGVIERFLDFGFLQSEIESILIGVSNQRLILDNKGFVKSIYVYEYGEDLIKLIRKEKKSETIEQKIEKFMAAVEKNKETESKSFISKSPTQKRNKKRKSRNDFKKS